MINQKYSLEIEVSKNASDLWSILYTKKSDIFGYLQQSSHSFVSWSHFFPRTECEIQERIRAVIANLRFLRCNFSLLHSGRNLIILFKNYNTFFLSYNIKAWFDIQKNVTFRLQMTKTKQMLKNYLDAIQSDFNDLEGKVASYFWTKLYKNCHCGLGEWWTGQIPCEFQIL